MKEYIKGAKAGVPVIFGFIPVAIAYAVMAKQAGISAGETVFMSMAVFAGAAQMMACGMYAQGAGVAAIVLTTFILNLRHLIMSTCVINKMKGGGMAVRLLSSFGVTDESFAIFTTQPEEHSSPAFDLALISVTYSSWVGGAVIGTLVSEALPPTISSSLGIALYAMFIVLLVPGLRGNLRLGLLVALTAVINSVLSLLMSSSWALIAATLLCAFLGVFFVELDEEKEDAHEA